jgi:hypothetical protein
MAVKNDFLTLVVHNMAMKNDFLTLVVHNMAVKNDFLTLVVHNMAGTYYCTSWRYFTGLQTALGSAW